MWIERSCVCGYHSCSYPCYKCCRQTAGSVFGTRRNVSPQTQSSKSWFWDSCDKLAIVAHPFLCSRFVCPGICMRFFSLPWNAKHSSPEWGFPFSHWLLCRSDCGSLLGSVIPFCSCVWYHLLAWGFSIRKIEWKDSGVKGGERKWKNKKNGNEMLSYTFPSLFEEKRKARKLYQMLLRQMGPAAADAACEGRKERGFFLPLVEARIQFNWKSFQVREKANHNFYSLHASFVWERKCVAWSEENRQRRTTSL